MYVYPYGDSQQLNLNWIINKLKELEAGSAGNVDLETVSEALISLTYNPSTLYVRYDYAFHNGKLYRCLSNTSGAFDPDAWQEALIGDDLAVLTRWINALNAAAVVDVKFDTSGTNGKLQQKYNDTYHDVVEVDYTPVQYSKRPLSSNAGYDLNGAINSLTNNKNIKIVSGAIRNAGSGWSLINDSGHNPINITGVSVQSLNGIPVLKIDHDVDATKIITLMVGCDETFASLYDIGASVGLNYSYLYIYRKAHTFGGMVQIVDNAIDTQYSDFTAGTFYPDGNFVLNFPETLTTVEDVYSAACAGGEGSTAHIKSLGYSNAIVRMNALDGTAWDSTSYPNQTRIYLTFNIRERIADPSTIINANGNFWILGLLETA